MSDVGTTSAAPPVVGVGAEDDSEGPPMVVKRLSVVGDNPLVDDEIVIMNNTVSLKEVHASKQSQLHRQRLAERKQARVAGQSAHAASSSSSCTLL